MLKQGVFILVVFFLLFLVAASRAFLAPNEAPPPRAPNPMALPAAMNAGTSAAKGRRPPFCLRDFLLLVPLHLFFLLRTMMSSCRLREYTGIMTMDSQKKKKCKNSTFIAFKSSYSRVSEMVRFWIVRCFYR